VSTQTVWKISEAGSTARGQSDVPNDVQFYGFSGAEGMTLLPASRPSGQRKVLFLGDSFIFGSGTMVGRPPIANDPVYNCRDVPDYFPSASNYWSWPAQLCREMDANCHYIGRGGRGMYMNSDFTVYPRTLPHLFSRTLATTVRADWDHSKFIPDVVFIVAGQNDFRRYAWPTRSGRVRRAMRCGSSPTCCS
jgi:hypothetical protein